MDDQVTGFFSAMNCAQESDGADPMTDFGPFARWPNPRAYDLIAGYQWGDFQRSLLLGQRSWDWSEMARYEQKAYEALDACLTERGYRIVRSPEHTRDVVTITLEGIPPDDQMLPTLIEQWGLAIPKINILSLHGPVEEIGTVPIFKATLFGFTERADGQRRHGLNNDAWIVGRMDVCHTRRLPAPWAWSMRPEVRVRVTRYDGVRGSLKRARNTAVKIAQALPEWEEFLAWKARQAQAAEEVRLEAERQAEEIDDPGVESFAA